MERFDEEMFQGTDKFTFVENAATFIIFLIANPSVDVIRSLEHVSNLNPNLSDFGYK
jgi:hypothetical protein